MSARALGYEEAIARNYCKLIRPPRKQATKLIIDGMEVSKLGDFGVAIRVRDLSLVYPRWTQTGFLRQYVRNLNFVRKHFRLRWQIATKRLTEKDFNEVTQRLVLECMNVRAMFQAEVEMTEDDLRDSQVRSILFSFLASKFGLNSPMVRTVASRLLGCDQVKFQRGPRPARVSPDLRSPATVRSRI
jgi:hypothetical protein